MKLAIVDLDGTLFDTKDVNYAAYKEAVEQFGYTINYEYYCRFCNGRHYMQFLPQITTNDREALIKMHSLKKKAYKKYIGNATLNEHLVRMIQFMKAEYKIALVTTASYENCYDLLNAFQLCGLFDLILTHDDIEKSKPDPEGFIRAMKYFGAAPKDTVIFEDSEVGIEAAEKSGAFYYKTYRFN